MTLVNFDSTRKVYMNPEDDTWYQLKFDKESGTFLIIYYDREIPLHYRYIDPADRPQLRRVENRKILQTTYEGSGSIAYTVLSEKLDHKKDLRRMRELKDYKYERKYTLPAGKKRDLTNVANYLKMPEDFKQFFFRVKGNTLRIRTVVTQADIDKENLNIQKMEEYLNTLEVFKQDKWAGEKRKKSDWSPDGRPQTLKKNRTSKK